MSRYFKDIATVSGPQPWTVHHWSCLFQALVIMNTCFLGSRFVVLNRSPQSIKFWLHLLNSPSSKLLGPASFLLVFIQHGKSVSESNCLPLSIQAWLSDPYLGCAAGACFLPSWAESQTEDWVTGGRRGESSTSHSWGAQLLEPVLCHPSPTTPSACNSNHNILHKIIIKNILCNY